MTTTDQRENLAINASARSSADAHAPGNDAVATYRRLDARLAELGFETAGNRALWWHRAHPQLDGAPAIVALLAGRVEALEQILVRLEEGAHL